MLSKSDKTKLRGMGQKLRPLFQIGKDGITENLCATLSDSLEAHELSLIHILLSLRSLSGGSGSF